MTNQMAMNFTIGLVIALLLLAWIGMVIFKNNLVMKQKNSEHLIITSPIKGKKIIFKEVALANNICKTTATKIMIQEVHLLNHDCQ